MNKNFCNMDYEKKYNEALEAMSDIIPDENGLVHIRPSDIFPELAESEDEKTRKVLVGFFKSYKEQGTCGAETFNGIPTDKILAWLEKQGEQAVIPHKFNVGDWIISKWGEKYQIKEVMSGSYNLLCPNNAEEINSITQVDNNARLLCISDIKKLEKQGDKPQGKTALEAIHEEKVDNANKVEPKFKIGDWIISNNKKSTYQVIEVKRGIYVVRDNVDNHEYHIGIEKCEKSGRLWTIKDAKDGDVLVSQNNKPFIHNGNIDSFHIGSYCGISVEGKFRVSELNCHWTEKVNIHPATKEQRDLLFAKMREAGYEWDAEKKELKRIEQVDSFDAELNALLKKYEQLPKEQLLECMNFYVDELEKQWRDEI